LQFGHALISLTQFSPVVMDFDSGSALYDLLTRIEDDLSLTLFWLCVKRLSQSAHQTQPRDGAKIHSVSAV